jgi:GntR family transcriptional regulator/MocR family aminotransferase
MLELAFRPDRRRGAPLYRQLADHLRELVEAGRLRPGQKLPATRELAVSLGVSRTTANLAYESLVDAGLARAHVGQGTFVAEPPWGALPSRGQAASPPLAGGAAPPGRPCDVTPPGFAWEGLFATQAQGLRLPARLREAPVQTSAIRFDFRAGRVDPTALPGAELRRAFARVASEPLAELANRLEPYGWRPLRREVARALVARGIRCEAEEVLVLGGAQQALDLVARVLVDPGDAVVVEQPGYLGARLVFEGASAHLVPCPVDEEGLRTDQLARVLRSRRVKLVYATPAVQAPTGVRMSDARRRALLELAEEHQTPIVEDDYDSELRLGGPAIPALKTEDDAGRVIYVGTFSKAVFPGLRLGYVVAARPLLARLAEAHYVAGFGTGLLGQAVLAELLASGGLERHVRRVRKRYGERLEAMLDAFDASMPEGSERRRPVGGNAIWATLPPGADAAGVHAAARAAGIVYAPGPVYFLDDGGAQHLQLGFASLEPPVIAEGIAQLGEILRRHTVPRAVATPAGRRSGRPRPAEART